jgi:hypothetical protein
MNFAYGAGQHLFGESVEHHDRFQHYNLYKSAIWCTGVLYVEPPTDSGSWNIYHLEYTLKMLNIQY